MIKNITVPIILISMIVTGCAVQRYGRQQNVTNAERDYLDCRAIEVEIAKTQGFIKDATEHKEKFTGKDVIAFLGDFGIGDSMEYSAAMKSATNRMEQLQQLKQEKGCTQR